MNILRKSALVLAASLLTTSLLLFGLTLGIERVLGTPNELKQALHESGVYSSVVTDALAHAEKEQPGLDKIPVEQAEIQAVIGRAFPPEFLQAQTERVIDGLYAWLRGDTPNLSIGFDVADARARLSAGISAVATARLASLPACDPKTPPADIDPFTASCLPRGVNPSQVVATLQQQVQNDQLFTDTTFTTDELKTQDGRKLDEAYRDAPKIYQNIVRGVYAAGVLAALLALAVVLLSADKRRGLRKVAIISITVGAIVFISSLLLDWLSERAAKEFTASSFGDEPLQQKALFIAQHIAQSIHNWWFWTGLLLVILGIGVFVALHFIHREPKIETPIDSNKESTPNPEHKTRPEQTKKKIISDKGPSKQEKYE